MNQRNFQFFLPKSDSPPPFFQTAPCLMISSSQKFVVETEVGEGEGVMVGVVDVELGREREVVEEEGESEGEAEELFDFFDLLLIEPPTLLLSNILFVKGKKEVKSQKENCCKRLNEQKELRRVKDQASVFSIRERHARKKERRKGRGCGC
jgi:hypothetical protein